MTVVPASTPVTSPDTLTVATAGVLLVQVPPEMESEQVAVAPGQIVAPVVATTPAKGNGFIETDAVEVAEPQLLVVTV